MALFRIRFVAEADLVSAAIRAITHSLWSHTEIILEDGSYLGAHLEGGVAIRPAAYCKPARERRYALPVTDQQLSGILEFAHAQVGKPYGTSDIFSLLTDEDWNDANAWICSALVCASAAAGRIEMLNVVSGYTYKITPEMLHLSPLLIGCCYYQFEE